MENENTEAMRAMVNQKLAEGIHKYGSLKTLTNAGFGGTIADLFTKDGWESEDQYLWLISPCSWLNGRVPAELLGTEPVRVLGAAYIATLPNP